MLLVDKNKYLLLEKKSKLRLWDRIKLCFMIILNSKYKPKIRFDNNVEIDLSNNKIIFLKPLHIHCNENLTISSSKHIIIDSGKNKESEREGYNYSIWLNSPKDDKGNPVKKET